MLANEDGSELMCACISPIRYHELQSKDGEILMKIILKSIHFKTEDFIMISNKSSCLVGLPVARLTFMFWVQVLLHCP